MSGIDTRLDITLPPPGDSGSQYTDLAVKIKTGKPVGADDPSQTLSSHLKTIFGDDITSLAEAEDIAKKFNINLQIGGSLKNAKAAMQDELDNLDPSNPRVPILSKYIDICDKLLQGANIAGVDLAMGLSDTGNFVVELDADNVGGAAGPQRAGKTKGPGTLVGNPWLKGNAYVAFILNFLTLAKLMMENMMVEAKCETASLQMMFELGQLAAKQITTAGEKAAEMHRVAAYTSMVAAVTIFATTMMSLKSMSKNRLEPEPPGDRAYTPIRVDKPPPDLNIKSQPILDSNGVPKQVKVPKYVQMEDGQIYRNEGTPMYKRLGRHPVSPLDEHGHPYLGHGREPIQISPQSETLGIKAVSPLDKDGKTPLLKTPPDRDGTVPAYEQMKVNTEYRQIPEMDLATGKQVMKPKMDPNNPGQQLVDPRTQEPQFERSFTTEDGKSLYREKKDIAKDNEIKSAKLQKTTMLAQATREFITQSSRTVEEFMKAELETEKAQAEAFKEILGTLSRLIGHAMERAADGIKANNDLFAQIIQQLDAIRAKLMEAISASYKKGGG